MNFKTQHEGNFCKLCKKSTHDLTDHMKTVHYSRRLHPDGVED